MKTKKYKFTILILVLVSFVFSTACDKSFYLTEREFYALQSQFGTDETANLFFGGVQGQTLRFTFDNSVSPPRVQSSNLLEFMRSNLTTFALLENPPFRYFQGERLSGEFEQQFDNWLVGELNLYVGENNADVRLKRIEAIRITFLNNPTFLYDYSNNKINFETSVRIGIDCEVEVNSLDPISNVIFGGINGSHSVVLDIQSLQVQGAFFIRDSSIDFKLTPQPGNVVVGERGVSVPSVVKSGIASFVKKSLSSKIQKFLRKEYEYFSVGRCRQSNTGFGCEYEGKTKYEKAVFVTVVRGSDDKLYQSYSWNGIRRDFIPVAENRQLRFGADPSITVSGDNSYAVSATTTDGKIFYREDAVEELVAPVIPPGTSVFSVQNYHYRGKPALLVSAGGQIEIVALRGSLNGNKSLLHLRRVNGVWTAPIVLNLPTSSGTITNPVFFGYRDPTIVQTGNKIFLLAATTHNKLYAMVFDMETGIWGAPSQISTTENVSFAPTLAASGDGRVNIVYIGQSGAVYHRPLDVNIAKITDSTITGFTLNPEITIPGTVNSTPALFSTGYRQLGLVARGTDNRLYYNRFVGTHTRQGAFDGQNIAAGWNGWGDLNGNFIGTQILSDGMMEEFTAVATKTGKVNVISKIRPNLFEPSTLHHNDYDAESFGLKPWKTVHWRGFQKMSNQLTFGRPAVAAFDGNFDNIFVGQNSNIYHARFGSEFVRETSMQLMSNPAPISPVATASGKGLLDMIAVGTDGKIKHIRRYNRFTSFPSTLPGQTNLTFQKRPTVVGYGEGQLDVVGVSTTGAIYHWRNIAGTWQNPVQISGTVSSSPILVNTGAGQLELFALGGDGKVYRWRFVGGVWSNWIQLASSFGFNPNTFGEGSASYSGNGEVDLVAVRNQAGTLLYHRHIEPRDDNFSLPNKPAQTFQSIGSGVIDQPLIVTGNTGIFKSVIAKDAVSLNIKEYFYSNGSGWFLRTYPPRIENNRLLGGYIRSFFSSQTLNLTDQNGNLAVFLNGSQSYYNLLQPVGSQQPVPLFRPTVVSQGGQ